MSFLDPPPPRASPRWTNLPTGWDTEWRAAKAAQGSQLAQIAVIGDSISAGQGSTDWINKGWVGKLRDGLVAAGNTHGGDYFPVVTYGGQTLSAQAGTMPFTLMTGGNVVEAGYGRSYITATSASTQTTFTSPYACVAMDILYVDYATGSWTYSVDGGTAQTVTTTGNATQTGAKVKKVSITGLTSATHTVAISGGSVGNAMILVGVSCYTTGTGIAIARSAHPGARFVDLATNAGGNYGAGGVASFPPDKLALWQGMTPGGASPTGATGFGFPTAPHLTIISMGVNDASLSAPLSIYRTCFHRVISAVRRGNDAASVLILAPSMPDSVSTDNAPGGRGYDYGRYKAVMREMANVYGCAWVDIDSKWGSLGVAKGFQPSADIHPLDAGHADIAAAVQAVI